MNRLLFLASNLFWLSSSLPAFVLSIINFHKIIVNKTNGNQRLTALVFLNLSSAISLCLFTLSLIGWNAFFYGEYTPPWQGAITFQLATLLLFGIGPFLGFSSVFLALKLSDIFDMAEKADTSGERYDKVIEETKAKKNQAIQGLPYLIFTSKSTPSNQALIRLRLRALEESVSRQFNSDTWRLLMFFRLLTR